MSKAIKKVVSIAAPIAGAMTGNPWLAVAGGALGGAAGGGGLKGALMGGLTGYLGSGAGSIANIGGASVAGASTAGTAAGAAAAGKAALMNSAPSFWNTGVVGGVTRALSNIPTSSILNAASGIVGDMNKETAEDAARKMREASERGMAANTAAMQPYTQLGADATSKIKTIQDDPAAYIRGNELYGSLAEDAERRLLANQAAKGKVGSGGTAAALQDELLRIGTGLVNTEIGNLQGQAGLGANAASQVGNTAYNANVNIGNANAAGIVGANQAMTSQYQNQINTILAMQGMNRAPVYSQPINL